MNPNAPVIPALSSARAFLKELEEAGKMLEASSRIDSGPCNAFNARLAIKRLTAAVPGEIAALDAAIALAEAPVVLKTWTPWAVPS